MKQTLENDEEYENQEEVYFQTYENLLKNISIFDMKKDKPTYEGVYNHCVNSYFDFIEPEIENIIEQWIHYYNLNECVRTCDILPLIYHHIDIPEMITKDYVINNPECVYNYINNKINNTETKTNEVCESYTNENNERLNKKFDWSTRKYIK